MNTPDTNTLQTSGHKQSPMIDLLVSIIIPSVILMKFSGDEHLGAINALLIALAFPLSLSLFELIKHRKFNPIALLGVVSVVLTGGIGLLQLDSQWLAIKEAAIPGLIGIVVLLSVYTPYPAIRTLFYKSGILHIEKIQEKLEEQGRSEDFQSRLQTATYFLSGSFFFSSFMNYMLAKWVVTSPTGTTAFNEELGRMTLLSYPVIAIPSMLMMLTILYYLWRNIHNMTGLSTEQILLQSASDRT